MAQADIAKQNSPIPNDVDPAETAEWLESLDYVLESKGPERVQQLLTALERSGASQRRRAAVHGHHAVHQHDPARQAAALPRQPRARAPHQELHPLERDGDGRPRQPRLRRHRRPHLAPTPRRPRCTKWRFNHFFRGRGEERLRRRPDLFPGPRLARHVRAGVSRRPAHRTKPDQLPPRAAAGRRPVVVSASLADARVLGIPHRLDGPRPDHGDLPGAVQPLPHRPRHQRPVEASTSGRSWATANATSPNRSARSRSPRARSSTT